MLRLVTYLAPSVPMGFYLALADRLAARLGREVTLRSVAGSSGPAPGVLDPFARDEADVGFVCAASLVWLEARRSASLLGLAPVHRDARNGGRPVYFAEVVVAEDAPYHRFADLRGARMCFNDQVSLTGYFSLLDRLGQMGETSDFFSETRCSGSHLASLGRIAGGSSDVATVDSNFLAMARARLPALAERVRVIEALGPFAVQPVVVRAELDAEVRRAVSSALADMHVGAAGREVLALHGVERFAEVGASDYEPVRRRIREHSGWPLGDGRTGRDVL